MSTTPAFADLQAVPYFFKRTRLPPGGLAELFTKSITPLLNVAMADMHNTTSAPAGLFPLALMSQSPNIKEFLCVLGKPLAIANELESRPGVWWLSTADGQHDVVIFSDQHRKSSWKGGQLCIGVGKGGRVSSQSIQVLALAKTFEAMFGPVLQNAYDPLDLLAILRPDGVIGQALKINPSLAWPVWTPDLPAQDLASLSKAARQELSSPPSSPPRGSRSP